MEFISPRRAVSDTEIAWCFDVMSELRPHLQREGFVTLVRELEKDGLQLAYISDGEKVVTVAGYRYAPICLWAGIFISMIWLPFRRSDPKDKD